MQSHFGRARVIDERARKASWVEEEVDIAMPPQVNADFIPKGYWHREQDGVIGGGGRGLSSGLRAVRR